MILGKSKRLGVRVGAVELSLFQLPGTEQPGPQTLLCQLLPGSKLFAAPYAQFWEVGIDRAWAAPALVFSGCTRGTSMALARHLLVQHPQLYPNTHFVEFLGVLALPAAPQKLPAGDQFAELVQQQHFIFFCRPTYP